MNANRSLPLLALAAAALLASGCERISTARANAGLVAAKVNGTEISLRQVRGTGGSAAAGAMGSAAAGGTAAPDITQALERVIERELLVQQAVQAGLERDPQVKESIDGARRQLLAEAWLDKVAAGKTVTRQEVRAFYDDNPALFAERRIYRMRELAVAGSPVMADVVRAEAARVRDLDELAGWLRTREARFTASAATLPAEQVPLGHLAKLARMKDGEIAVFAVAPGPGNPAGGVSVVQLVQAEDAPLSEAQAAPVIEQFLAGRKRLQLAAAEVRRLREVATIEYAGEFKRSN